MKVDISKHLKSLLIYKCWLRNDIQFDMLDGCFDCVVPVFEKPVDISRLFNMYRSNRFYHKEIRKWSMGLHFAVAIPINCCFNFLPLPAVLTLASFVSDWANCNAQCGRIIQHFSYFITYNSLLQQSIEKERKQVENYLSLSYIRIN